MSSDGLVMPSPRTGRAFQTIIISANIDLSLRAFEYGLLDLVPKPVDREQLSIALRRVARHLEPTDPPDKFLTVMGLCRCCAELPVLCGLLFSRPAGSRSGA